MASFTGLFQRGTAYCLCIVLPHSAVIRRPPEGPHLREIYNRWKESKPRSPDSLNNCFRSVNLFEEFTGNPPINPLTGEQGDGFRAWTYELPAENKAGADAA